MQRLRSPGPYALGVAAFDRNHAPRRHGAQGGAACPLRRDAFRSHASRTRGRTACSVAEGSELDVRALYSPGSTVGAGDDRTSARRDEYRGARETWPRRRGRQCRRGSAIARGGFAAAGPRDARRTLCRSRGAAQGAEGGGYSPAEEDELHAVATDPISLAAARSGSLYPDHVVFLGPGIVETERMARRPRLTAARRAGQPDTPLVIVPGAGVLLHDRATASARALARCLADVTSRSGERRSDRSLESCRRSSAARLGRRGNTASRLTRGRHDRSGARHRCRNLRRAGGGDRSGRACRGVRRINHAGSTSRRCSDQARPRGMGPRTWRG